MLYGCYAMFGLSLIASLIIITMVWSRLAHFGTSGTARVPTLWIVLGPLGQSITAAGLLGTNAALAVDPHLADGMSVFAVLYGVPVWGFAVLWIALATALTVRTLRRGMPFALTWWSLTFPVGTFVTGTTQLAVHTGLPAFRVAAAIAYVGLLCTWCWWRCGRSAVGCVAGCSHRLRRVRSGHPRIRHADAPSRSFARLIRAACQNRRVHIGMTMPVMEPDLDAATLKAWALRSTGARSRRCAGASGSRSTIPRA